MKLTKAQRAAAKLFRPGDRVTVEAHDGTVVRVNLSTEGVLIKFDAGGTTWFSAKDVEFLKGI